MVGQRKLAYFLECHVITTLHPVVAEKMGGMVDIAINIV